MASDGDPFAQVLHGSLKVISPDKSLESVVILYHFLLYYIPIYKTHLVKYIKYPDSTNAIRNSFSVQRIIKQELSKN